MDCQLVTNLYANSCGKVGNFYTKVLSVPISMYKNTCFYTFVRYWFRFKVSAALFFTI